jgi:hypothetical protein
LFICCNFAIFCEVIGNITLGFSSILALIGVGGETDESLLPVAANKRGVTFFVTFWTDFGSTATLRFYILGVGTAGLETTGFGF